MHVVQSHPVPYTGALHFGRQSVANLSKCRLQSLQPRKLLGRSVERNADNGIHIGTDSNHSYMNIFKFFKTFLKKRQRMATLKRLISCLSPDIEPKTVSLLTPAPPQAGYQSVDNLKTDIEIELPESQPSPCQLTLP
jgi:hypothetical protein